MVSFDALYFRRPAGGSVAEAKTGLFNPRSNDPQLARNLASGRERDDGFRQRQGQRLVKNRARFNEDGDAAASQRVVARSKNSRVFQDVVQHRIGNTEVKLALGKNIFAAAVSREDAPAPFFFREACKTTAAN